MIKLKLTKHKIGSLMLMVAETIVRLQEERKSLSMSLKRAEITAHVYTLHDLNKKLKLKLVQIEDRFQDYSFSFQINEMQAYLLMLYRNDCLSDNSFNILTIQQISEPIFKHLLN